MAEELFFYVSNKVPVKSMKIVAQFSINHFPPDIQNGKGRV